MLVAAVKAIAAQSPALKDPDKGETYLSAVSMLPLTPISEAYHFLERFVAPISTLSHSNLIFEPFLTYKT